MTDKNEANGHPSLSIVSDEPTDDLVGRLTECIDELDALGRFCEANHVALARDLLLRSDAVRSLVHPEHFA